MIGAILGMVAGILQRRSIRSSPAIFTQAKSALEVRRAFMSNRPGKLSIALPWATGVALLVIALAQVGNGLVTFLAGYLSFMFVREVASFGATDEVRSDAGSR